MKNKLLYADFKFLEIFAKDAKEVCKFLKELYANADKCTISEERENGVFILELTFKLDEKGRETDSFQFKTFKSLDSSEENLWTIENHFSESLMGALKEAILSGTI